MKPGTIQWPWSVVLLRGLRSRAAASYPKRGRTVTAGGGRRPSGRACSRSTPGSGSSVHGSAFGSASVSLAQPRVEHTARKGWGQGRSCLGAAMSCQRRVPRWFRFVGLRARGRTVGGYRVVLGSVLEAVWSGLLPGGRVMVCPPSGCSAPGRLCFRVAAVIGWPGIGCTASAVGVLDSGGVRGWGSSAS